MTPLRERLREAARQTLGLQLDASRLADLEDLAEERRTALGLADVEAWLARLEAGEPEEEGAVARRLTVGETYFFRNENDLKAFVGEVVPERVRARGADRRLRFLSAGCASGEEPYTLAMLLRGMPFLGGWELSVRGVDVNPAAVARGRSARYGEWSLRQTPADLRARFFRQEGREYRVNDDVRALVALDVRNLSRDDGELFAPGSWDAVFCRNVLMYLAPEVTRRIVDRLATALAPGGFLFLGHAENLRGVSSRFHLRQARGTFFYQRREDDGPGDEAAPAAAAPPRPPRPPRPAPVPAPEAGGDLEPAPVEGSWVDAIAQASARVAALTGKPLAPPARPRGAAPDAAQVTRAFDFLRRERFADALSELGSPPLESERDPDVLLLRAVLLASGGRHAEAEAVCARLLAVDELSAEAHYVKALCREHAGDPGGAADEDRYAAYLDPTFAMPRLHLGLMHRRAGELDPARRELARARVLLAAEEASRVLLLGGGFSREALSELCRAELRAAGGEP
ncbi:CheR family methyltransferase [Anaeromyxobacter paludicola]|uniref:Protein-glutamate O-methyltransferase n=1 Tax=Anaeromyxobacter paludicola TaxID=2918171 RepID=A0ABM7XAC2_9BACT|nr:CheR family methyltransferase [Anaeromyxobacter paludicola]BDG08804.1 protein-glutamate O-methyltransferase [Anaeromyxobacter paludicola]